MLHGDELESHEEKHEDVIEERTIYRAQSVTGSKKALHTPATSKKKLRHQYEIKLHYFDYYGRGEPIRMLLHAANQPFEDVRYPYEFKD
jgi:hypothetical protein